MRFVILYILLSFISIYSGKAQSCLPTGIVLTTQAEIDNFKTNYPGCTRIDGSLTISGSGITNLLGLNAITSVGFSLRIEHNGNLTSLSGLENIQKAEIVTIWNNVKLENLHGLEGLDSIDFTLGIFENPKLASLDGLGSLKYVASTFSIVDNILLPNLSGLNSLRHIGGLFVDSNDKLVSLNGMPMLSSFEGLIDIQDNALLSNINALQIVVSVTGGLKILRNPSLNSLSAFSSLTHVEGNLEIFRNASLQRLDGLNSLTTIEGDLIIADNAALISVEALDQLVTVEGTVNINENNILPSLNGLDKIDIQNLPSLTFQIFANPLLSDCSIDPFCDFPNLQSAFDFHDNTTGCNSIAEVQFDCLVAVHDPYEKYDILLFPNPTSGTIEIKGIDLSNSTIQLTDSQGRMFDDFSIYGNTIAITDLPDGLYLIYFQTNGYRTVRKIIKN